MAQLQIIQQKIFEIRGQKVMFDFDLAELYEVETKVFNQAVKRNIARFPEEFMFQLTAEEWKNLSSQFVIMTEKEDPINLRSQFVTSSWGGRRWLPFAFTEHGITMLASILKSDKAIKMNIAIVKAFIALRKFAAQYSEIIDQLQELKDKIGNHDVQLNQIYDAIENLLDEKEEQKTWHNRQKIGFKK